MFPISRSKKKRINNFRCLFPYGIKRYWCLAGEKLQPEELPPFFHSAVKSGLFLRKYPRNVSNFGRKKELWEKRCYQTGDCTADLVLAATNCPEVNDRIESECRSGTKKILFNRCDRKENCDFYFPALVEHDGMVIAISSSGTDYKKVKDTAAKLRAIFAEQDR